MLFLNIPTEFLKSAEYLGCEPVERATWLSLMGFCAIEENGGRIENAKSWGDRRWQQLIGITKAEAETQCELWEWDGDDLVLPHYPSEKEAEVRAKREGAKKGAFRRWQKQRKAKGSEEVNASANAIGNASAVNSGNSTLPKKAYAEQEQEQEQERNGTGTEEKSTSEAEDWVTSEPPADAESGERVPSGVNSEFLNATKEQQRLLARIQRTFQHIQPEWIPRLTQMEMINLRDNLGFFAELQQQDWQLLRWWYQRKRPALAKSKPSDNPWPFADRAGLIKSPSQCLDAIRDKWNRSNRPALDLKPRKGKESGGDDGKKPADFGEFLSAWGYEVPDDARSWENLKKEYAEWKRQAA